MIRVAGDAHQKRRHGVVIDDAVKALAANLNLTTLGLSRAAMQGRFSHKCRVHRPSFDFDRTPGENSPADVLVFC
jgi:hypothetical protein